MFSFPHRMYLVADLLDSESTLFLRMKAESYFETYGFNNPG